MKKFIIIAMFILLPKLAFAQVAANTALPNLDAKTTPVGADIQLISDSADSNYSKRSTIAQILTNTNIPNDLTINSTADVTSTGQVTAGTTVGGVTLTMTGAGTMTTLNTGQGANELYDMDQNVLQASDPTFNSMTLTTDLTVPNGGTGASTFTDGGILLGSGAGAITALGAAANGQIPIGDGATDPVLATITATANETTVTNGAGSITIGLTDPIIVDVTGTLTGNADTATLATFATSAGAGDTATGFFSSGTIEHEYGGLEAAVNAYDGLIGITGGSTFNQTGTTTQIIIFDGAGAPTSAAMSVEATMDNAGVVSLSTTVVRDGDINTFAKLDARVADKSLVNQADGATWTGTHDFEGATVALPTSSVTTNHIADGTIIEPDLNVSNSPTDNYLLSYNAASTNFTWVVAGAGGSGTYSQGFSVQAAKMTGDDIATGATINGGTNSWETLYDDTTEESMLYQFTVDENYAAGTLTLSSSWYTSVNQDSSRELKVDGKFKCVADGENWYTEDFSAEQSTTVTMSTTAGDKKLVDISFSQAQADGIAVGEDCVLIINRDPAVASDMTGDARNVGLMLHE